MDAGTATTIATCDWYNVPCVATGVLTWLFDAVTFVPRAIWSGLLAALAAIIAAIPIPDFVAQAVSRAASMGAVQGFAYFANICALGEGVSTAMTALTLRFLLRRIPLIG